MKSLIYLDSAATTPAYPEVVKEMQKYMQKEYGNPSSMHQMGEQATKEINKVREKIARELGCKTHEIIFTSGATESNNLAIQGVAKSSSKKRILMSAIEHPSVTEACNSLKSWGYEVLRIPTNKEGLVNLEILEKHIDNNALLVSIMHVNNVFGTIQDLKKIGDICRSKGVLFHTDAAQSFGKLKIAVKDWNISLLSGSAHKIGGPKGVGFIYIKEGTQIAPLFYGGGQEAGLRSGTENVAGIAGLGKALEITKKVNKNKVQQVRNYFAKELEKIGGKINGPKKEGKIYNNIHVSFPNANAEDLILKLSQKGIYVSAGSACDSKKQKEDEVLKAIGLSDKEIKGSMRISLSESISLKEVNYAVREINKILAS